MIPVTYLVTELERPDDMDALEEAREIAVARSAIYQLVLPCIVPSIWSTLWLHRHHEFGSGELRLY